MPTNPGDGQGIVFRKSLGRYTVRENGRELDCVLSSRLHKQFNYSTADPSSQPRKVQSVRDLDHADPVAIGDRVRYIDSGDGTAMIVEVLPRRSTLSRPAATTSQRAFEQVIVSNTDQVVPVFAAASPPPKWGLLDRYLVSAEAAGLPSLIVITKIDLTVGGSKIEEDLQTYNRIGYTIHKVSSVTGEGVEALKDLLKDRTSVLIGKSGVGKTSLLNALQPGLGLRVKAVGAGELGKGRHTTTRLEMFDLAFGGALVDTPGMREFGLWDIAPEDLTGLFPDLRPYAGLCKFGLSCRHDQEPGCAVRTAVMAGQISPHRYKSFLNLQEEVS